MSVRKFVKSTLRQLEILLLPRFLFMKNGGKGIALTFDDGPDPKHTLPLLEELKRLEVRATFFLVGERISRYPEIVKKILDDGHEIGNHSMTHNNYKNEPITDYESEIQDNFKLIQEVAGSSLKIFRPPCGITTLPLLLYCLLKRITVVHWSVDFEDGNGDSDSVKEAVGKIDDIKDGDILLLHDDHPVAKEIVSITVPKIRANGFNFVTVSEML